MVNLRGEGNRRQFFRLLPGVVGLSAWPASQLAGTVHVVRKGDTLSRLARDYGVTITSIRQANDISGDLIRIGQKLVIPNRASVSAAFSKEFSKYRIDRSKWKHIVIHHSAIKYGNAEVYDRNHRRRGMKNGLAYHFVIGNGVDSGDGEIEIGSRWKSQLDGGHVRSSQYNRHGVGICLVGNFQETRPSARQMASLKGLIELVGQYHLNGRFSLHGHKEVDKNRTVCPGRNFPLAELKKQFA